MKRRRFIKAGTLGTFLLGDVISSGSSIMDHSDINSFLNEGARKTVISGEYDVIVCGAGPAGIAAAISAARNNAKTLLIEVNGCLGGVWTAGLLSWILDHSNKSGLIREIESRLVKMQGLSSIDTGKNLAFDVEKMKILLEIMCIESGIDVLLHTRVTGTVKNNKNRLTHIVTESKSFREAWIGKTFIDTTGDGDLAALSGCGFDLGSEADGSFQPMSMLALISGVEFKEIKQFIRWAGDTGSQSKANLLNEIKRAGINPSYARPSIFPIATNLYMIMANHQYGSSGLDTRQVTKATLESRLELHRIIDGLKSLGGSWSDLRIVATAEQIGVREGRRIHGLYKITQSDLVNGTRHPDAVCSVTFGVDVHPVRLAQEPEGNYNKGVKSKEYDIPLRALIPKDVDGLMMAGRCISGDFISHSSYRVTGNAVTMGEAAGKVSSLAAKTNRLPGEIRLSEIV